MSGTSSVSLPVSGLASGMNWSTIVTELANAERAPETQWQTTQSTLNQQNNAFGTIQSYLNNLQADITKLKDPTLFSASSATTSDSTIATATTSTGAIPGTYSFNISQLATAAQTTGISNISQKLVPDNNPADVTIGTAGFATAVTDGTFTVNGAQVTIASTDSLKNVFNNIASATHNAVTANYNSTSDAITLTSASPITLGSGADTSNFLQVAQLYSSGSNSVSSTSALGRAKLTSSLDSSGLATAITDGGSGNGSFSVNGVTINYNASTDSLQDIINRVNSSGAGVNLEYDSLNNRFTLANQNTGNVGTSLQDNTGNVLGAMGLTDGTLTAGKNLLYTVNGNAQQLQSESNTITPDSSTIAGLSLTALKTGTVSATVALDTSGVTSAMQSFVNDYNTVQGYITTQTASTTDSTGTVTAGLLTGDPTAEGIANDLRNSTLSPLSGVSGLSATYSQLANMGITSNGHDNTVSLDTTALSTALTNNLSQVTSFFTDATHGWATQFTSYLTDTTGNNGTLPAHETALTQQSNNINTQISNLETKITADSNTWTTEFQNMETATAQTNQELSYLSQAVSNGSL